MSQPVESRLAIIGFLLMLSVITCARHCEAYELLQPNKVVLEGQKYDTLRDPYIPQFHWVYGASLGLGLDLASTIRNKTKYSLFFNPTLKFRSSTTQIRQGGLVYEGGIGIEDRTSIFLVRQHESLHCLECNDNETTNKKYPLMDAWALRVEWRLK